MEILGIKLNNLTLPELLQQVEVFFTDGRQYYLVSLNPEMVVAAQKDAEFREALNSSDINFTDGFGLVLASWWLGEKVKQRIAGVDFIYHLLGLAEKKNQSVYLLGGQNGVAEKSALILKNKFQRLNITSGGDNLVPGKDDEEIIKKVNEAKPAILLVAFGHGRQEKWISQNLNQLPSVKVAMGVGGSFDFIAGKVRRAPRVFRALGLEWLWRLLIQPWRLKRILTATCKFSYLVIKSKKISDFRF